MIRFEELARMRGITDREEISRRLDEMRRSEADAPLFARIAAVIGAWLSGIFLAFFLALLLEDTFDTPPVATFLGGLVIAGTIPVLRRSALGSGLPSFLEQLALALNFAGTLLFLYGAVEWVDDLVPGIDESVTAVVASLALCIFVHGFSKHGVQQFVSVAWVTGTLLIASHELRSVTLFSAGLVASLALLLFRWHVRPELGSARSLSWSGLASTAAFLTVLSFSRSGTSSLAEFSGSAAIVTAICIPLFLVGLAIPVLRPGTASSRIGVGVAAVLCFALSWAGAPGVALSIGLMLLAHALGDRWFARITPVLLAFFLFRFYFSLATPLLDKAISMMVIGGVLLGAALFFRTRIGPPRPEIT